MNSPTARAGRSPAYPFLSLPDAIERARLLYNKLRKNAVSPFAAIEALGYSTDSGTSRRVLAALGHFGLLAEEGKGEARKVRLTEEARKILLLPDNDAERRRLVREAALKPKIYQDIVTEWPETLPTDSAIARFLTFQKGYNEDTVRGLIKAFRATYQYAELGEEDGTPEVTRQARPEDLESDVEVPSQNPYDLETTFLSTPFDQQVGLSSRAGPNTSNQHLVQQQVGISAHSPTLRTYTLPISGGRMAFLQAPPDMTPDDFELLTLSLQLIQRSMSVTRAPASEASGSNI